METNEDKRYMVEFFLPPELTEKMLQSIPIQQKKVNQYFTEGKLLSYTLASDKRMLWALFVCSNEDELTDLVESLPMTRFFSYEYHEVMFHEMISLFPALSLN